VSHLELKVLGALYALANGTTQFMVSQHQFKGGDSLQFFEVVSSHGIDIR
jgi:hypothetical protein